MKSKNTKIVRKYMLLLDELPNLIKASPIKEQAIYEKLGLSRKTWHNRKTLKNWSNDEVLQVLKMIEIKDN